MKKTTLTITWISSVIIFLLLISVFSKANHSPTYSLAAGNPSGLYYPYAGGLARIWSNYISDFNIKTEVTDASLANVIQVAVNESKVGFSQGDVVMDAYYGTGKFTEPLDISVLYSLYPNVVHVMTQARSNIYTMDDLRGKTVSVGAPGAGTTITALNILNTLGIDRGDINIQYLDYTETANAIRDGFIDAGFIVSGVGVAVIVELALTRDIRLINFTDEQIDQINNFLPAYTPFIIEEGIYHGVTTTQAPSVWNMLVVRQDLDEELAYELTKSTFEHKRELCQITYIATYTTPEIAHSLIEVPLHPGASRYFAELNQSDGASRSEVESC